MPEVAFYVLGDFPCSIWKHDSLAHLCGYVGLPKSHPWFGLGYDEIDVEIHGGLTWSQHEETPGGKDRCYPHETGDTWWVGFDCAHFYDESNPKDENYVRGEIESLVHQAAVAYRDPVE